MKQDTLYNLIAEMKEDIGHIKGTAEATYEQAKKTNGRILKAEADIEDLKGFKVKVTTFATIGATVVTLVINFMARL
jgi:hypothetical protein